MGSEVPLLMGDCGCLLTFLAALGYWLPVILAREKVLEEEARNSSIANLEH